MNYTQDQRLAIEARGRNLLLAAAAGSGKTFTLVERILHLLREGDRIDEMLIVTFTRAAAADMKAKLIERMSEQAEGDEHMQAQLRLVESASVCTIDAFCSDVLRSHFEAANVDPQFRIPDDAQLRQLEQQALQQALMTGYERGGDDLSALQYGRGVGAVSELVMQLYRCCENRPDPKGWLREAALTMPQGDGVCWFDELLHAVRRELRDLLPRARHALSLCLLPLGPLPYLDAIQADLSVIERALELDYDALLMLLRGYVPTGLGQVRLGKDADLTQTALKEQAKALRDQVKAGLIKLGARLPAREDAMLDVRLNAPALSALHELTLLFMDELSALKAEQSVLSFSDVAHRALLALGDPSVQAAMRARFKHIFVDEYQDVSDVQQALIERICGPDNVFMVGDVKQSIYRFRQAEPSLFMGKYQCYMHGGGGQLIALKQNFRSRGSVLALVNRVFERIMRGGDSEIEYDELARLHPGAAYEGDDPPVELCILESALAEEEQEETLPGEYSSAEREGLWIARRIREIMDSERYFDPKLREWRAYRPGDFAVLVRYRRAMPELERILSSAGLPTYADMTGGYLDALEVQVLRALLTLIENRRRDEPLLIVLHSPIGGLSNQELARIRLHAPALSFRDAVLSYLGLDDPTAHKLRRLESMLDRWRVLSRALPLSQLVDTVLRESGYYAHVGGLPMGATRQANLDLFCSYASDFDAAQSGALTAFLRYIQKIERAGDDMGAAHTLGEGEDVVRLITVHKSKGLEFPVVLAAQLGRPLSRPAKRGELCAHRTLGIGLAVHDMALGSRRMTLPQRAIHAREELLARNEEMRILYVLLTRAMDRLILVGSVRKLAARAEMWALGPELRPGCFLDAIAPLALEAIDEGALRPGERTRIAFPDVRIELHASPALTDVAAGEKKGVAAPADEALVAAAREALLWRYPHSEEVLLPLKLTVSALTRELTGPTARAPVTRRPNFLATDGLTPAERGTLTHAALRNLDLTALRALSGFELEGAVRDQLERMRQTGQLSDALQPRLIVNFLNGGVGRRLLRALDVRREWAFNLRLPLTEALGIQSDQCVLVQGVIDCCFIEDGAWVLLDYKTDRSDDVDALITQYRPQLRLYEAALQRITRLPVREAYLCLLRSGVDVRVE